jgi:hypothetical protein
VGPLTLRRLWSGLLTLSLVWFLGNGNPFEASAQTKGDSIGFVIASKGTASILSKSALTRPAALRQEVYQDDTVKTGLNSSTKVLFNDQTMLSVNENTEIAINQYTSPTGAKKRSTVFQMARGRVKAQVPDVYDTRDSRFEIRTPTAVTTTRGADYVVWTYVQKGRFFTGVAVTGGTVEVTNPSGQSMTVAPGFYSLASTEAFLSTPAAIQKDPAVDQLVQGAEVRTDPSVAAQVKLAQQQAPAIRPATAVAEGAEISPVIPGEQWVWYGGGGISRTMGTTNTPCRILSQSGNLPLGCTVPLNSPLISNR